MIKQFTVADPDFLYRLDSKLDIIAASLQNLNALKQPPEFFTAKEFMEKVKIGRWKFDMLVSSGLLRYKRIGKKFYVPSDQVQLYFDGKMTLEK